MATHPEGESCTKAPPGWWCSIEAGHEGPCAARPIGVEIDDDMMIPMQADWEYRIAGSSINDFRNGPITVESIDHLRRRGRLDGVQRRRVIKGAWEPVT